MEKPSDFKKGLLAGFIVLILLLAVVIISVFGLSGNLSFLTRASSLGAGSDISFDNSYIFASPISASADGVQKVRITVFILNSQGLGISGKGVSLRSDRPLSIENINTATDETGKALFDLSSGRMGDFRVEAVVDGRPISQTVSVSFR